MDKHFAVQLVWQPSVDPESASFDLVVVKAEDEAGAEKKAMRSHARWLRESLGERYQWIDEGVFDMVWVKPVSWVDDSDVATSQAPLCQNDGCQKPALKSMLKGYRKYCGWQCRHEADKRSMKRARDRGRAPS